MKKLIITVLICLTSVLASVAAPGKFEVKNITFSFPDDWNITDKEDYDADGYYVACEKTGENSSGLVVVTWTNSVDELESSIENYKAQLIQNYNQKEINPEIGNTIQASYGDFKALKITFVFSVSGVPHAGTIYNFHACGKTITVLLQEAVEDNQANIEGFKTIQQTFKCR